MSNTFDAGTVHAQLTLDRTNFQRELRAVKKDLDDLERKVYSPKVTLDVANFNREYLRVQQKMTQLQNRTVAPKIDITLNTARAWQDYLDFRRRIEAMPPVVIDLRIDTRHADEEIIRLRRELSGLGNAGGDSEGRLKKLFGTISKGAMVAGKSIMYLAAAASAPSMIQFVGVIGEAAVGLASLLPAAIAAAGTAIATLKIGFSGLGEAIKETDPKKFAEEMSKLAPAAQNVVTVLRGMREAWTALKLDVQQNMFVGLSQVIQDLGNTYLPVLRKGLADQASAFNELFKAVGGFLAQAQSVKDFSTIMANTSAATKAAVPGWTALLSVFRDLAAVGSSFLPGFAEGWSRAAQSFADFISHARETGQLKEFIQGALDSLKKLGEILGNLGGIFMQLFSAANATGASTLDTLVALTGQIREFFASTEGAAALQALFNALHQTMVALQPAFAAILTALGQIVTSIAPALPPLAEVFSNLLQAVLPVIKPLADVVSLLVQELLPALDPVVALVKALAVALGPVLIAAGNALVPIIQVITEIFNQLSPILQEVGKILGDTLVIALDALGPPITMLVKALGDMVLAAAPLLPAIANLVKMLISGLAPALPPVIDAITAVVAAFAPLVKMMIEAITPILPVVADLFTQVVQAIAPIIPQIISDLLPAVTDLIKNLLDLEKQLMPITVLFLKIATFVLPIVIDVLGFLLDIVAKVAAFLIDVLAGAIKIIVDVINGLIEAVKAVGQFFVWLWNDVLVPAWQAISDAVSSAWTNYIKPALDGIGQGAKAVGDAFTWLWENVIKPVTEFIANAAKVMLAVVVTIVLTPIILTIKLLGAAFQWLWENVVKPVWDALSSWIKARWEDTIQPAWEALKQGLQAVGDFFTMIWQSVIQPVWQALGDFINMIWVNVIQPCWEALKTALGAVGDFFNNVWNNVIKPAWSALGDGINAVWTNVIKPAWEALKTALGAVGDFFKSVWENVIKPVWNALGEGIKFVWENVIKPVFDAIKTAVDLVKTAFGVAVDGIKAAWDRIQSIVRPPVEFVVNVVYNQGIRPAWNFIAGLFNLPKLDPMTFATGGVVPGYAPGRDTVPAMLSPGEGVLVPEAVKMLGGPRSVLAINNDAMARSGRGAAGGGGTTWHFADGGIVGSGSINAGVSGNGQVGTQGLGLMDFITDPVGSVKKMFNAISQGGLGGAGLLSDALRQFVPKAVDGAIEKVKAAIAAMMTFFGGGGGGAAPPGQINDWIMQALAILGYPASYAAGIYQQIMTESGGNPSIIQQIHDVNSGGNEARGIMQVIPPTFAAYALPGHGNIFNPVDNIIAGSRYAMARYGPGWFSPGPQHSHGYDSGGVLMPGTTLAVNKTGKPEAVLTQEQWRAILGWNRERLGGNVDVTGKVNDVVNGSDPGQAIRDAMSVRTQALVAAQQQVAAKLDAVKDLLEKHGAGANFTIMDRSGDPTETARAAILQLRLG